MNVHLTPHSEELIQRQIARGAAASPEDAIERALETWTEQSRYWSLGGTPNPVAAVAAIRELRKGNSLRGLKIKDLVDEGRKY